VDLETGKVKVLRVVASMMWERFSTTHPLRADVRQRSDRPWYALSEESSWTKEKHEPEFPGLQDLFTGGYGFPD